MNYKVLYRKYRPNDFDNVIGQDYIIKTLKNSIYNKNFSHAYIFSGPRGTGKTSTAKVFSKAINCLGESGGIPCGKCEFCVNFAENPDVIEIDAASNNGVDEIRSLIDNIKLTPTNGKYKIYIIDEVHMLTTNAFNALLLTLEEPPKHAIFILATTNIENVPITILSRCQRFDFQKIKIDEITKRLLEICNNESIEVEEDALNEIAYLSEGGMRDALSLLDQLSKSGDKITLNLVENQIKTISQKNLNDLVEYIEINNITKFLETINEYRARAIDYKTLIKRLIENLSLRAKNIKLDGKIKRLEFNDYKNMIINLTDCLTRININVDPYTILEITLLEYFDIKRDVINTDKEKIEDKIEINKPIEPKKDTNYDNLVNVRINNCFVNAQKHELESMKGLISNYLSLPNVSGKFKSLMSDVNVVAASDKYAILTYENDHISKTANGFIKDLEMDIKTKFSKNIKLVFVSENRWLEEKSKYIDNLKNNIKYEYIKENDEEISETQINDVFDINKVEII